ncbi:uncharacterized protein TRAVEDRAFT_48075 [Trametes versicolor FP-101664 SS1]|uniref:uncharacterized protein n=1 Tax=Trametes versicolor (strain FP-101664) TaxID=717944 RepID=UPI00046213C3|nr:uncharacterized protein TRAVEDRAFT_48075 [Trametes versicolor FP-101664 SS1]EIW58935.1 hypothetical protein TRAVEDRAFT_48075 [Trametes versicolor FP-101664 SS1]
MSMTSQSSASAPRPARDTSTASPILDQQDLLALPPSPTSGNTTDTSASTGPLNGANDDGAPADATATSEGEEAMGGDGRAELQLDCEEASLDIAPDAMHVYLMIEGTVAGRAIPRIKMAFPSTIARARALSPHAWYAAAHDAISRFEEVPLTADQRDAVMTVSYVHRWFAQKPLDADYCRAWDEMRDCLRTSIAMGRYLQTPGEDLIQNLAEWARFRIPDVYPPGVNLFGMFDPWDGESDSEDADLET